MSPATTPHTTSEGKVPEWASTSLPTSLAGDASPSDPAVLRTLYSGLLKTRLLEEHVLGLQKAGTSTSIAVATLGGEATEVGACIGLQAGDSISSSWPTLAAHVVLGAPIEHILAGDGAQKKRSKQPRRTSGNSPVRIIPQTATLTGQFSMAAGVALAYQNLGCSNVVVALAADALAALGSWHETARLAAQNRSPMVFMVENCAQSHPNGVSTVHSDEDLRDRAEAYGFPGITVDGNDIVAVWRVTQESIHRARTGAGPTLIECRTWRWHPFPNVANRNGRIPSKPSQARWQHDPLHQMEHYMKKRRLWRQDWKDELVEAYRGELQAATAQLFEHRSSR